MIRVRYRRDGGELARNMSAPPRTTLNFTALTPAAADQGDPVSVGAGLRFVCRLDPRSQVHASNRQTRADASNNDTAHVHQRIRAAILYARAEVGGKARIPLTAFKLVMAEPIEALADELQALLTAAPMAPLAGVALPGLGLLLPVKETTAGRAILPGFIRTLAILGRRRGSLFMRAAQPIVWTAMQGEPMDLWLPIQAAGSMA